MSNSERHRLLTELLQTLRSHAYKFTTVTPLTHSRFLKNSGDIAKNLKDIFGWNLPFKEDTLAPLSFSILCYLNLLKVDGNFFKSRVRVSSIGKDLFLHSEYPTDDVQSVFFGPDTYRFVRFIKQTFGAIQIHQKFSQESNPVRILDVGCGSGAGGVVAARLFEGTRGYELTLNDINSIALEYAAASIAIAGISAQLLHEDFFNIKNKEFDVIVSNPPYICDRAGRAYRDGGRQLGLELSLRIVKHALQLLAPGGQLLLYTGVAMTDATNPLLCDLAAELSSGKYQWSYEEIDPDIFGEELEEPEYSSAYRIAAIGLVVTRI